MNRQRHAMTCLRAGCSYSYSAALGSIDCNSDAQPLVLCRAQCEFLQCTVLGKHGAVSDDVTLRGRDVIFFLKQAKIILRCRYAPGMPRPGVSK